MVRCLGALAKNRDCVAAVLTYSVASRLIYGFAIFHATLTAPKIFGPICARIPAVLAATTPRDILAEGSRDAISAANSPGYHCAVAALQDAKRVRSAAAGTRTANERLHPRRWRIWSVSPRAGLNGRAQNPTGSVPVR